MAISYPPLPGDILVCDFSTGFRPPEMVKRRPAVVISPRLRHRDGLCTVVPLSTTPPRREVPYQCAVTLPYSPPPPFERVDVWAKADMVVTVAYERLDLFRLGRMRDGRRRYLKMRLHPNDLEAVRSSVRAALGLAT